MNYETIGIIAVACVASLAILWFLMLASIFRGLRTRHPEVYESLESPSFFADGVLRNNGAFFKYLFGGGWKNLQDPKIVRLCKVSRFFLPAYVILFGALVFLMVSGRMVPGHQ